MKKEYDIDPHWGSSLKHLKWDKREEVTDTESLISHTIAEWYQAKHPVTSKEELTLINNIQINHCPHCGSTSFYKNGYNRNGVRSFRCKECNRKFTPLANTIFQDRKIPISEWIEYLLYLFEFHSLRTASRDNRNAISTGRYWLYKVFAVLKDIQDNIVLEDTVYIDETFFPVVKSKEIIKDGKKLRGVSRNKLCIAAGYDTKGNMVLITENTSKPSDKSTWAALGSHIKEGSTLIHDGEKSHHVLVEKLNLTEKIYKTEMTKGLDDKDNPLTPINKIHMLAKQYMKAHGGYDRDELQDWMNLIWFILSKPENRYEKVQKFIDLAINSPRVVKYRELMADLADE